MNRVARYVAGPVAVLVGLVVGVNGLVPRLLMLSVLRREPDSHHYIYVSPESARVEEAWVACGLVMVLIGLWLIFGRRRSNPG